RNPAHFFSFFQNVYRTARKYNDFFSIAESGFNECRLLFRRQKFDFDINGKGCINVDAAFSIL
ncbi:MAG TPA: hypothetical protein PLN63_10110, partial [Paludibacteraceae bacterium]|nr:hypothetical protein [Paludibacteraceae bacterium]HPH63952.1 hypothetical protein [Paludibacteraceae bacterium]